MCYVLFSNRKYLSTKKFTRITIKNTNSLHILYKKKRELKV